MLCWCDRDISAMCRTEVKLLYSWGSLSLWWFHQTSSCNTMNRNKSDRLWNVFFKRLYFSQFNIHPTNVCWTCGKVLYISQKWQDGHILQTQDSKSWISQLDPATYWTCRGHLLACQASVWVHSGSEGRGLWLWFSCFDRKPSHKPWSCSFHPLPQI